MTIYFPTWELSSAMLLWDADRSPGQPEQGYVDFSSATKPSWDTPVPGAHS